jgi:hypothetical protein
MGDGIDLKVLKDFKPNESIALTFGLQHLNFVMKCKIDSPFEAEVNSHFICAIAAV